LLSAVIATQENGRALLPTLAALVPGAAGGLVREVIIADGGSRDETALLAEAAGCRLVTSEEKRGVRLCAAARAARSAWLLFLQPGCVPEAPWIDETARFMEESGKPGRPGELAAAFRPVASVPPVGLSEALSLLAAVVRPRRGSARGLLIARAHYERLGGHGPTDAPERELMWRLGRSLVLLRCGATMLSA
jgi:hypothetical protein